MYLVYGDKALPGGDDGTRDKAQYAVEVVENVKNDWTTVKLDLKLFCKDAGVYVLEFVPDVGKDLDVQSINLLSRGQKLDNSVRRRRFWGTFPHFLYDLTITKENSDYGLQAVVRMPLDAPSHGRLMITRRLQ